jgi:hypothetical protein
MTFFNAEEHEPQQAFTPLPPGWYHAIIVGSEEKFSDKAGAMLKLTFEIDSEKHLAVGARRVFSNLCINHPTSGQARDIARSSLSAICHATQRMQLQGPEDLLGAVLQIKLKIEPERTVDGKTYEASNGIAGYKAVGETTEAKPAATRTIPAQAPAAAPAQAPAAKGGWKR